MTLLLIALAFAAGFLVVVGMNLLLFDVVEDRRRQVREKLAEEMRLIQAERARTSMSNAQLYEMALEGFVDPDARQPMLERLRRAISQSGMRAKPEQIVLSSVALAVVAGAGAYFLLRIPVLSGMAAAAGAAFPFLVMNIYRKRRRAKLLSQLPDAYEMMGRVLRAGQTLPQAMRSIADEFTAPLSEEIAFCWEQQRLGLSPEASFRELARRTGILEIKIFVVALVIHRQSGGNLSSLLQKLSEVIREREQVRLKVSALTAEGQMQAYILGLLPIGVAGFISATNPTYLQPLLDVPIVFMIAGSFLVAGFLWIQRIINFDF
jgi:tight adherence protein B